MKEFINISELSLSEKVIKLNRCSKVVSGGRRFSFSALVVVGDKKGYVGVGFGKANEIPNAIVKGINDAKKNIIKINVKEFTIPHEIIGKFRKSNFWMKPATPGTGLVTGKGVRALFELAGIHDILSKAYGSKNIINSVKAAFKGLSLLRNVATESYNREKSVLEFYN